VYFISHVPAEAELINTEPKKMIPINKILVFMFHSLYLDRYY